MSDLSDRLVATAAEAIRASYDDDPVRCNRPTVPASEWEARAAVVATLRLLLAESFPDDDVDYHYATEGLTGDVVDTLAALAPDRAGNGGGQGG